MFKGIAEKSHSKTSLLCFAGLDVFASLGGGGGGRGLDWIGLQTVSYFSKQHEGGISPSAIGSRLHLGPWRSDLF